MERMLHIVDSGAYTLFNLHNSRYQRFCITKRHKRKGGPKLDYSFYKTKEFWKYVDDYAKFLKQWEGAIDNYVTVDACRNPELSWKIHQYLIKEHGLRPLPVIHFGADPSWIDRYMEIGHDYLCIGGRVDRNPYFPWADRIFNHICNTRDRLPICKTHGLAITSHQHFIRYPWYSCDSTTSKKCGYYGQILVPRKRNGEFCWYEPNLFVFTSLDSPYLHRKRTGGRHFFHFRKREQQAILEWLEYIGVPFGKSKKDGTIVELGVINCKQERVSANIKYFLWLQSKIPPWPWPFRIPERPTLESFL